MSFAARLVHTITIERTTLNDTDPDDSYGQPEGATTQLTTKGLIQPKRAEEMVDALSAGAMVADHTIFLQPQLLYGSDVILDTEGQRYRITGIRSYEMGRTPHIEVDAMAISRANDNFVAVGS
jgi:hypothetical protein